MSDPRPDLKTLRRDYQVAEEGLISYSAQVVGEMRLPTFRNLTSTEGALRDELKEHQGVGGLAKFYEISEQARETASWHFPDRQAPKELNAEAAKAWQNNDGHRDAFRHAYWNARLTQEFGVDWTRAFTTAHEGLVGNPANREAMDLYNNAIGIGIAQERPRASPSEMAALIEQAVRDGKTVVIDRKGDLEWSDRVPLGGHGISPRDTIAPAIPTPAVLPLEGGTPPVRHDRTISSANDSPLDERGSRLLLESDTHIRALAKQHHLPWDRGMDNTVAAVAQTAYASGMQSIDRFTVNEGTIRLGEFDGYTLKDASVDALRAANTPVAESLHVMAQEASTTTRSTAVPDNEPAVVEYAQRQA